jgi:hypothetical protein
VFYIILFSALAVLLVVAGVMVMSRRRTALQVAESESHGHVATSDAARHNRKAQRAQSRHDRRKRH